MRKERIEDAVLRVLGGDVLRPEVISAVLDGIFAALAPEAIAPNLERARAELATVEREIARLVEALAYGGEMESVVAALKARQGHQQELRETITAASTIRPRLDRNAVERQVRKRLTQWRALLAADTQEGRQLFREVLAGPIGFTPEKGITLVYRFEGEVQVGHLFAGIAGLAPFMASPTGFEPVFWP